MFNKNLCDIKICGLTCLEDIQTVFQLGGRTMGFILADSPRQVGIEWLQKIVNFIPPFVFKVAVVVNPSQQKLEQIMDLKFFDAIQFHGSEKPEILARVNKKGLKVIKAFSLADKSDLEPVTRYQKTADILLFDTRCKGKKGGTGKTFNWSLLDKIELDLPFILAGGLGPDNLSKALQYVKPDMVDINSQVEEKPGIKNKRDLKKVFNLVREYNLNNFYK